MHFLLLAVAGALLMTPSKALRLEAETGMCAGTTVAAEHPGYSGTGYVTGFTQEGSKVTLTARTRGGLYTVRIGYRAPYGPKGYVLVVNGAKHDGMFAGTGDAFSVHTAGKVELREGENALGIEKGWGWYDVDFLELVPARASPKPKRPPAKLADPQATPRVHALLELLVAQYGRHTLSGQYEQAERDYVRATTGHLPAILGGDLSDYSPSRVARGADPKGLTERLLAQAQAGAILTLSWHWNAPKDLLDKEYQDARGQTVKAYWWAGFYTYATTFDVQRALDHPDSEDYRLLLRDIDAIAVQLKKLAAADVPVLWRPLHEAEGGWFWWGAKGQEAYRRLWRLLFDRLTGHHGLHNLIWVHTGTDPAWYPGDDCVDIVGVDAYPTDRSDPLSGTWDELAARFDGRKLLAVSEFGGAPDVARMYRFGARWSYFVSWSGEAGPHSMDQEALRRIYAAPEVLSQEALPPATAPLPRTRTRPDR